MHKLIIAAIALALLIGCASSGVKVDPDKTKQIVEGQSTKADVIALFGNPNMVTMDTNGKETLMYSYAKTKAGIINFIPVAGVFSQEYNTEVQQYIVLIGTDGKVEKAVMNASNQQTKAGLIQ